MDHNVAHAVMRLRDPQTARNTVQVHAVLHLEMCMQCECGPTERTAQHAPVSAALCLQRTQVVSQEWPARSHMHGASAGEKGPGKGATAQGSRVA